MYVKTDELSLDFDDLCLRQEISYSGSESRTGSLQELKTFSGTRQVVLGRTSPGSIGSDCSR